MSCFPCNFSCLQPEPVTMPSRQDWEGVRGMSACMTLGSISGAFWCYKAAVIRQIPNAVTLFNLSLSGVIVSLALFIFASCAIGCTEQTTALGSTEESTQGNNNNVPPSTGKGKKRVKKAQKSNQESLSSAQPSSLETRLEKAVLIAIVGTNNQT